MTTKEPQLVDKYLEGIDPAKRIRHRGIFRTFQYHESVTLGDIPAFVKAKKREYPEGMVTPSPYGMLEEDGFYYFYMDEYISLAESMQEAAATLKRNRSTIVGYCKRESFPYVKNPKGGKGIDIIAAQDWILWNTEYHAKLEPYWPKLENNCLTAVHADEIIKPEPLFHTFNDNDKAA